MSTTNHVVDAEPEPYTTLPLLLACQMMGQLDAAGCRSLPEEAYPRSLVAVLPIGKRVNLRLDVPNKHEQNSAAVAYWQVRACAGEGGILGSWMA